MKDRVKDMMSIPPAPRSRRRRATVLLMVVSLLALLFVIITGFLSLSRNDRQTQQLLRKGAQVDALLSDANKKMTALIGQQFTDASGKVLSGPSSDFASIPGYRRGGFLGPVEPVWDEGAPNRTVSIAAGSQINDAAVLNQLRFPSLTLAEDKGFARPPAQPFSVLDLIVEDPADTDGLLSTDDILNAGREMISDADGDGFPDSFLMNTASLTEAANAAIGVSVRLRDLPIIPSQIPYNPGTGPLTPAQRQYQQALWQQFLSQARFVTSTRVLSNGGMVTLSASSMDGTDTVTPYNRDFMWRLLDSMRNPADTHTMAAIGAPARTEFFNMLASSASEVEAALRRRNGLPSAMPDTTLGLAGSAVPAPLAILQGADPANPNFDTRAMPATFSPQFQNLEGGPAVRGDAWQMFNFAGEVAANERYIAARALSPQAWRYNFNSNNGGNNPGSRRTGYNLRGRTTMFNSSDELALKQAPGNPNNDYLAFVGAAGSYHTNILDLPAAAASATRGSTYEGELKFSLHELAKCFEEVQPQAGTFSGAIAEQRGSGVFRYVPFRYVGGRKIAVGDAVVERLARLYYDMLASHSEINPVQFADEWDTDALTDIANPSSTGSREAVSRRNQAWMLAVNTVQAAMPRDVGGSMRGYMDVVSYTPQVQAGGNPTTYYGYAPQPYISEAIIYRDTDDSSTNNRQACMAVELYNPNDPYFVGGTDPFAISMDQYAIGLNDFNPNSGLIDPEMFQQLSGANLIGVATGAGEMLNRLPGRTFTVFAAKKSENSGDADQFDAYHPIGTPTTMKILDATGISHGGGGELVVRLWRRGMRRTDDVAGSSYTGIDAWNVVDTVTVQIPNSQNNWNSTYRDTTPVAYYGEMRPAGLVPPAFSGLARWRVASGVSRSAFGSGVPPHATVLAEPNWIGNDSLGNTVSIDPDVPQAGVPMGSAFAPVVPLICMNSGKGQAADIRPLYQSLNDLPMFGNSADLRPRSYPTVGFMLFLSRYSHVFRTGSTGGTNSNFGPVPAILAKEAARKSYSTIDEFPTDFGHMPVFDNRQKIRPDSYVNQLSARKETGVTTGNGTEGVPWGQLVFEYFTVLDHAAPGVDPLRVAGRIDVNSAPWMLMSRIPMMGPALVNGQTELMLRSYAPTRGANLTAAQLMPPLNLAAIRGAPSPAFWRQETSGGVNPGSGVLIGEIDAGFLYGASSAQTVVSRLLSNDAGRAQLSRTAGASAPLANEREAFPFQDVPNLMVPGNANQTFGLWRLGGYLAQSAVAHRDGVQVMPAFDSSNVALQRPYTAIAESHLRNGRTSLYGRTAPGTGMLSVAHRNTIAGSASTLGPGYGAIRGQSRWGLPDRPIGVIPAPNTPPERPLETGFISVGELLNVRGWDSTRPGLLPRGDTGAGAYLAGQDTPAPDDPPNVGTVLGRGDYIKAVSLVALLDSQYLATRGNTFTVYTSIVDRENREESVRSQMTVDRSNLLPRLTYEPTYGEVATGIPSALLPTFPMQIKLRNLDNRVNATGLATTTIMDDAMVVRPTDRQPTVLVERKGGYYNARFDK